MASNNGDDIMKSEASSETVASSTTSTPAVISTPTPAAVGETGGREWDRGMARVKAEYLIEGNPNKAAGASTTDQAADESKDDGNNQDDRGGKGGKQKFKKRKGGQNQDRVVTRRVGDAVELCFKIGKGQECQPDCKFNHDKEAYLAAKEADIGDRCVNFDLFGECPYGYKCRYLKAHMAADGSLVKNEEKKKAAELAGPESTNVFSHDLTQNLRQFKFDFSRSQAYLKTLADEQAKATTETTAAKAESTEPEVKVDGQEDELESRAVKTPVSKTITDTVTQEDTPDVKMRPSEKKHIDFRGKTYLAPLTTVGNLPFRRICKDFGVDITCGEMAMAPNLVQGQKSELALLRRHKSEDIFGVQITGNKVDVVVRACDMINQVAEVDFVDLNMGCPIDQVFNNGAGSGLLGNLNKVKRIVGGMNAVLDVPVTVKYRMAIQTNKPIGEAITPKFHQMGANLGTLHGRSRQQRYTKMADWEYIRACTQTDRGTPGTDDYMYLFGNGDILNHTDYYQHLEQHQVDGCMIARGALMKPWIFDEIKQRRDWDISSGERFDILKKFCNYGLEHWGSDTQGVNQTRRFLLEWQSFLYRYIPVGVLEVLPQRINERPPAYVGRNDLETLMASGDVNDWIKLSDMILGPAPPSFRFDPKHKANSTNVEG